MDAWSGSYDRSERPAARAETVDGTVAEAVPRNVIETVAESVAESVATTVEAPAPPRPAARRRGHGRVRVPLLGRLPLRRVLILAAWFLFAAVAGWHRLSGLDAGSMYLFAMIMVPMAGFLGFIMCGSLCERTRRPVPRLPWRGRKSRAAPDATAGRVGHRSRSDASCRAGTERRRA
jgi:hypothetical protein